MAPSSVSALIAGAGDQGWAGSRVALAFAGGARCDPPMRPRSATAPYVACYAVGSASLGLAITAGAIVFYGLVRMSGDCFATGFPSQNFFVALFAGAIAGGVGAMALALFLRARTNGQLSRLGRRACSTGAEFMGLLGMAVGALSLLPAVPLLLFVALSWPLCVD